jgi:hypothetical protein
MRGMVRESVLRALVAEAHRIDAGEEGLASAQKHGGDHEVDLVDQPGGEVLADGGNATAEPDVLALGHLLRALQRGMDAIGHEVKGRSALHRDRRTGMVRQHEDGHVVGRVVARILGRLGAGIGSAGSPGEPPRPSPGNKCLAPARPAENGSAKDVMKSDQLRLMARDLAEMVKKMPKLDWTQRESVRADLRRKVRRLLAMYGYPPDLSEDATQLVLKQAELSTQNAE